ncbi:terpenoid synthase [Phlegmacium glaucopus]|nr:terpenoid synthase [Phlegmacium glaucopus]
MTLKMINATSAIPDLFYPKHPFEVKLQIAKYIWLAYAIEYSLVGIPEHAVEEFQHRLVSREPQLHPLLDHYSKILADMRLYWHPLAADCIVTAGIQIIWASLLQHDPKYKDMRPRPGGDRLPGFVRRRDGVSEALSFMTFTKDQCPDMYSYLQAIPDMCLFIDYANDIFRFHSDDKAGDMVNYIRERAAHANKSHIDVLYDVGDEVIAAQSRVDSVLSGQGYPEEAWQLLKSGLVAMHKSHVPYGLSELGLGEEVQRVRKA